MTLALSKCRTSWILLQRKSQQGSAFSRGPQERSICVLSLYLFWLCWFFVAACGHFSSCRTWTLEPAGSVVVKQKASGILVPWPGIEPTSPALEGGFLTTGPLEKSLFVFSQKLGRAILWEFEVYSEWFSNFLAFLLEKCLSLTKPKKPSIHNFLSKKQWTPHGTEDLPGYLNELATEPELQEFPSAR